MKNCTCAWPIFLLILIVATACGSPEAEQPAADMENPSAAVAPAPDSGSGAAIEVPADLLGSWTLVALDTEDFVDLGKTPTVEFFEEAIAGGVSGVNQYRAAIEVSDGRLSFGQAAGTKMAGPPEAMSLESAFLKRLAAVSTYTIEGDTLRLWAGDNEALTFIRTPEPTP